MLILAVGFENTTFWGFERPYWIYANSKYYPSKLLCPLNVHLVITNFEIIKISRLKSVIYKTKYQQIPSLLEIWRPYWIYANLTYFSRRNFGAFLVF